MDIPKLKFINDFFLPKVILKTSLYHNQINAIIIEEEGCSNSFAIPPELNIIHPWPPLQWLSGCVWCSERCTDSGHLHALESTQNCVHISLRAICFHKANNNVISGQSL